jgi:hypothetical protein
VKRILVAATAVALSIGTAASLSSAQQSGTTGDTQTARDEFHRGQDLYDTGHFDEALDHFRASLNALESPNTLLYVGRCQRELGHPAAAFRSLDRAAALANLRRGSEARFEDTYRSAVRERDAIASLVGFVVIRSTPDVHTVSGVVLGGETLGDVRADTPIAVSEGDVELVAQVDGEERRRTIHVIAGSTNVWDLSGGTVSETPPRVGVVRPTNWPPLRIAGLTTAILGVGSLTAAIATGVMAQNLYEDLNDGCAPGPCPQPGRIADANTGITLVTATKLLIGVGATLAVAGGLGFFLGPRMSGGSAPRASNTSLLRTGAAFGPMQQGGWMLTVTHAF